MREKEYSMGTRIFTYDVEDALEVKESYTTVKNRLFRSDDFIEVTTKQGKVTLAKGVKATLDHFSSGRKVKAPQKKGARKR